MSKNSYNHWTNRQVHWFCDLMEFIGYGWELTTCHKFDWLKENAPVDGIILEGRFSLNAKGKQYIKLKGWIKSQEAKYYYYSEYKLWYVHCELINGEFVEKPYATKEELLLGFYPNDCKLNLFEYKIIKNPYFPNTVN